MGIVFIYSNASLIYYITLHNTCKYNVFICMLEYLQLEEVTTALNATSLTPTELQALSSACMPFYVSQEYYVYVLKLILYELELYSVQCCESEGHSV